MAVIEGPFRFIVRISAEIPRYAVPGWLWRPQALSQLSQPMWWYREGNTWPVENGTCGGGAIYAGTATTRYHAVNLLRDVSLSLDNCLFQDYSADPEPHMYQGMPAMRIRLPVLEAPSTGRNVTCAYEVWSGSTKLALLGVSTLNDSAQVDIFAPRDANTESIRVRRFYLHLTQVVPPPGMYWGPQSDQVLESDIVLGEPTEVVFSRSRTMTCLADEPWPNTKTRTYFTGFDDAYQRIMAAGLYYTPGFVTPSGSWRMEAWAQSAVTWPGDAENDGSNSYPEDGPTYYQPLLRYRHLPVPSVPPGDLGHQWWSRITLGVVGTDIKLLAQGVYFSAARLAAGRLVDVRDGAYEVTQSPAVAVGGDWQLTSHGDASFSFAYVAAGTLVKVGTPTATSDGSIETVSIEITVGDVTRQSVLFTRDIGISPVAGVTVYGVAIPAGSGWSAEYDYSVEMTSRTASPWDGWNVTILERPVPIQLSR